MRLGSAVSIREHGGLGEEVVKILRRRFPPQIVRASLQPWYFKLRPIFVRLKSGSSKEHKLSGLLPSSWFLATVLFEVWFRRDNCSGKVPVI